MGNEYYMSCEGAGAGDGMDGWQPASDIAPTLSETLDTLGLSKEGYTPAELAAQGGYTGGIKGGEGVTPEPGPGPGIKTLGGESGGGVEAIKEEKKPIVPEVTPKVTPEVTPEVTKEKEKETKGVPKAKKRQRRPTILTGEEGLMYTAPGKRRSLLGG